VIIRAPGNPFSPLSHSAATRDEVAERELLGGVVGGGREAADEVGADGAGEGFGDVGEDVDHGVGSRLGEKGRDVVVSYIDCKR
jgi:hypothetical protein